MLSLAIGMNYKEAGTKKNYLLEIGGLGVGGGRDEQNLGPEVLLRLNTCVVLEVYR